MPSIPHNNKVRRVANFLLNKWYTMASYRAAIKLFALMALPECLLISPGFAGVH